LKVGPWVTLGSVRAEVGAASICIERELQEHEGAAIEAGTVLPV